MPQRFFLGDKPVRVSNLDLLGTGGQAKVFMIEGQAVKWWTSISRSQVRKVEYLLKSPPKLPDRFLFPKLPFRDEAGSLLGYSMDPLPRSFGEGGILMNKGLRLTRHITIPTVLAILDSELENMNLLHKEKIVQGDVSSRNYAFVITGKGVKTYKYDTDSFVIAGYPCPVWTELFLCPDLYKYADGKQDVPFSESSDRYGYDVILFWSLLNTNPYQQTHLKYPDFKDKAQKGIWLLDPGVKYPLGLCPHPETVNDELLHIFEEVFKKHNYSVQITHGDLVRYGSQLIECPSCQKYYPNTRASCPNCTMKTPTIDFTPTYRYEKLMEARGQIIFSKYQASSLFAISLEKNGYFLHIRPGSGQTVSTYIPVDMKESFRFDIVGDGYLVANPIDSESLFVSPIADLSNWITTNTVTYKGNRQAAFRGTAKGLLRMANDQLLLGEVRRTSLVENPEPTTLSNGQSWFWAEPSGERIVTLTRYFSKYQYGLVRGANRYDIDLTELEQSDTLIDISAYFGGNTVCVRRMINRRGRSMILTDVVDKFGKNVLATTHLTTKMPGQNLHTTAFEEVQIYWPTDGGVVIENLKNNTFSTVPKTEKLVSADAKLIHLGGGKHFLVVHERKINYLVL
ncbi:MAG: hypothetical protein UW68_C0004G0020 [Candidatus Collierbacteria bacterium GW2011_GWB1_44_6]|uniref:Protein kinase domain-containing protein n=2 Tax=Candidatus Collieribacteriota TaxID=1752725 RepID=A0A0G1JQL6_9BACT|nr:MAG: hypothetical protein UV68_C0047G0003 [Candidatus Collierbacteria bacterium GW2011_GWC2_43_12]KKT73663.1 MAG: hypothetical protein UW68_C0004G0020 [Candidatus Collierbacteria bacterium GW2011_GWB1_44_6]